MNPAICKSRQFLVVVTWCLIFLLAGRNAGAQTRLHLPSQTGQADFSQFPRTQPARMGAALPSSCLDGELFFHTNAAAGSNLYVCAESAWYPVGSTAGGAGNVSELNDFKVSVSGATVSIGTGRVQALDSAGRYTVTELPAATVSRTAGSDTGTLRVEVDPNGGAPVFRCWFSTGITVSNYTAAGCVTGSQSQFSTGAQPLASLIISNGTWGGVVDLRALGGTANYVAGSGLTKAGNTFSVNAAVVGLLSASNTWAGRQSMTASGTNSGLNVGAAGSDPSNLSNGDIWYNTSTGKLRCRQGGTTVNCTDGGVAGGGATQVQYNDAGALNGDSGLTWNKTSKALTVAKSVSGAQITAIVTSALAANDMATVQGCLGDDSGNCAALRAAYLNFDGAGDASWTGLVRRNGANSAPLVARGGDGTVHVGGAESTGPLGAGPGWMTVSAGGVTRFANAATVGLGLAPIAGELSSLNQTGDPAAVSLVGASHPAGTYRICGTISVKTAGTGSFSEWTASWRDPSSGLDAVRNLVWDDNGTLTTTPGLAGTVPFSAVCKVVRSTGESAISINPGNGGSAVFDVRFVAERIQ